MTEQNQQQNQQQDGDRTWYEEFTVSGSELLDRVKQLIHEGNVRRVFIKNNDGDTLLEFPLTAGIAVTAITAAVAPVLVAVGAVAALVTQVTVGVERREGAGAGRGAQGAPAQPANPYPAAEDATVAEPPVTDAPTEGAAPGAVPGTYSDQQ